MIKIRAIKESDREDVVRLWTVCDLVVSWNDPNKDIERNTKIQAEMFLVGMLNDQLIATVMAGFDGHRGWINYLAVHPDHQRRGIGKAMMNETEKLLREKGCPKINLQVRRTNTGIIKFYKEIGFKEDDVVSFGKRLEADN